VGREHQGVIHGTNYLGLDHLTPGHDKFFAAWPFFFHEHTGLGTTNPVHELLVFPFYHRLTSPNRDSTGYLYPLFSVTEDREKKYREWDAPWPLVGFARGEGKYMNRVWPFYSHATNAALTSDFLLWPIYKYNAAHSPTLDRERTRLLLFLYSDVVEKNPTTGATQTRTDLWPLFTHRRGADGRERLQVLAPFEPIVPGVESVARNWAPLWSLYRAERNAKTGHASQSLLWNLWREDATATNAHASFFFGVAHRDRDERGVQWHWFDFKTPPSGTASTNAAPPAPVR
jgi:hypothetical protein